MSYHYPGALPPAAHILCRHADLLGHLDGRLSLSQQTGCTPASSCQLLGRTEWSHALTNVHGRRTQTLVFERSVRGPRRSNLSLDDILIIFAQVCQWAFVALWLLRMTNRPPVLDQVEMQAIIEPGRDRDSQ